MDIWPGRPYPLGATWDGDWVNFAIYSEHAEKVELCLFDSATDIKESHRVELIEQTDMVFHGYLPNLAPGQLYGYRVYGPYDPNNGHRFNPNKIVLDPYAKSIGRVAKWDNSLFGHKAGSSDITFDNTDNAAFCPLASVIDPAFMWGDDHPLRTPWNRTFIYEAHVKGLTKLHPQVNENQRGTYAGLVSKPVIDHLLSLNVTAVELMPVHAFMAEHTLVEKGLSNFWGYNTLSYFSPHVDYASRSPAQESVSEFKTMVKSLHAAGIEVILDVVYNHTCESHQKGPTLSWRGVDNATYYRLTDHDKRYYTDFTGCGNTLNMTSPRVLQMIMDSLRYWVIDMHVDGFRFDLASTLARELHEVDRLGAFFDIIHQDPVLSQVKLIAEPWDVGPGGYQVGNFPVLWTEWNGKYRDCLRRYWKGDGGLVSELATRLTGSSDLYARNGRKPYASINFITAHDGFTLTDLVGYNEKHNAANGEMNRDGTDENYSWNCGTEGPTSDPKIVALRERQKRNLFASLMFSQGVAMLCAGDELSQTKGGNNNSYCQDNELSWLHWDLNDSQKAFLKFAQTCSTIWREQPVLRRRKFFAGKALRGSGIKDVTFVDPFGEEMNNATWFADSTRSLGLRMAGHLMDEVDERGQPINGDTLLLLLNSHWQEVPFSLPETGGQEVWEVLLDTAEQNRAIPTGLQRANDKYPLFGQSLVLMRCASPK